MGTAAHLMIHTVTLASQAGVSNAGDPTYGAQAAIKARVEHKMQKFITPEGNNVQAAHRLISESEVKMGDRVWLPGDDTADVTESRRPIWVGQAETTGGYILYEAVF